MKFKIDIRDKATKARTGMLTLNHGIVKTPAFMPVGTNGTVKALHHKTVQGIGFNLILANTYHLFLRPGWDVIKSVSGLHRFMGWTGNILTDSGGYQIFSLAPFRKIIPDQGIKFRSHIDGTMFTLSPESVIDFQQCLGSDVCMPLDVCTAPGITYKKAYEAAAVTTAWAERSRERAVFWEKEGGVTVFGIIQGNFFRDLREKSAHEILNLDFPGVAIGGLSVGETPEIFSEYLHFTAGLLPDDKPRYVMGIGTPGYLLEAVEAGIDMFDCVFPTRIARNGTVFTKKGPLALKKEWNRLNGDPIDETCTCTACSSHSVAYLRHLFKCNEILGAMLATEHNLHFINSFMENIRLSIEAGNFPEFKRQFLEVYRAGKHGQSGK